MDEPRKASQSAGSGQSYQRPVSHSRPFFYVQPPVPPFYTHQWPMSNPYSHNLHGSGFHFGRSCVMPYSYLQYPGYVVPHAAVHPVDYRRIYERNFPPAAMAASYDFGFRPRQPSSVEKATTCAGAQTDPCETLNKLIECLDQLRAGDESHSRTESQTSGSLSPLAKEERIEDEVGACAGKCGSNTANVDPETDCSGVECLTKQEEWPVMSGKEPSQETSPMQVEISEARKDEDNYMHHDFCLQSQNQSKDTDLPSSSQAKKQEEKVPDRKGPETKEGMEQEGSGANWTLSLSSPVHLSSTKMVDSQCTKSRNTPADISSSYSCCILHLPFEKVLNADVYAPGSTPQSLGSSFSYSYCPPQLSHERVSVLSPSLDELSSHDELLSTDLEDVGLFSPPIYTRGKLTEVASRKCRPSVGKIHADMCVLYPKKLTCAVCGSNAFKERSAHTAFHCETCCYGDVDETDEELMDAKSRDWEMGSMCRHYLRGTMMKMHGPKKTHPPSKHRVKHREKFDEPEEKPDRSGAPCTLEHLYCEKCTSSKEKSAGHSVRGISTQPFKERRCRKLGTISDQIVWESTGVHSKPQTCRVQSLPQRKERMGLRKSRINPQGSRNDSIADDGDEDDDEESQEILHFHRGKGKKPEGMVFAASQHPAGVGPQAQNIPPGNPPVQDNRPPVPGHFRGPHPDRQQHNNWPFFYIQPSQPYLPYQWPMPMPCVPYGGFPGMSYGMVVPPFPPPYMETPGYILPHAQLQMVDYRRMVAPHLAPSVAYQSRRFRFQHTTPSGRVMVSSEVQTEPVCTEVCTESGRGTASSSNLSLRPHEDASASPEEAFGTLSNRIIAGTVSTASNVSSVAPNSEIVFQAQEVRIECSETPAGLKITHAKETTELASNGELLQCNMGSVQSAEDMVLRCYQPLPFGDNKKASSDVLNHTDEEYLLACPDILMMGTSSSCILEGSDGTQAETGNSMEMDAPTIQRDLSLINGEDICRSSKSVQFKILRLPYDLQCLDELRQMEASVWSVESLVPYVPSSEWMMQDSLLTTQKPSLTTVLEVPSEVPTEANKSTPVTVFTPQEQVIELDGHDSMTSLESLPPYINAASWLADLSNVYDKQPSKIQQRIGNERTWPEGKLCEDTKVQSEVQSSVSPNSAKSSASFKEPISRDRGQTAGLSLSDQHSCLVKSRLGMTISPEHKVRICKRCQIKQRTGSVSGSPDSTASCVKRYKAAHSHLRGNKAKVHLCALCSCDAQKKARCKSASAALGIPGLQNVDDETTEWEVSENCSYPAVGPKKSADSGQKKLHNTERVPSGRHSEKCTMARQSKLREQNCSCEDSKAVRNSTPAWGINGCTQHDAIWEKNEENMAVYTKERWRDAEGRVVSQKQKEKSRRGGMRESDAESTKSTEKMTIKHKLFAQTPETHRRDTRC